jgi:REP element-mobilizing transposase RayT
MILAHHLVWVAYSCWLPNDPRGSWSADLRVDKLAPLGPMHYGRKEQQPPSRDIRAFYQQADDLLEHPRLLFTDDDIALLGERIGRRVREHGYTCYGCSIMTDHVHLLIRRHRDWAEQMLEYFQEESRRALIEAGRRPANHSVWGGPGWKAFKSSPEEIVACIKYIRENPIKAGRPAQYWDFVTPYDGWIAPPARKK